MFKSTAKVSLSYRPLTPKVASVISGNSFALVALACLLTFGSCITSAQTGQRPFVAPEPVELGFVESATGNLHLEIPLGSFPQRASGQPARYFLAYDSNIWSISASHVWQPSGPPYYVGWRTVTSNWLSVNYTVTPIACWYYYQNFNWIDPLGVGHFFPITTVSGCSGTPSGDALAADSSGYHMYVTNYTNATVYAPDGTLVAQSPYVIDSNNNDIAIKDANGNYNTFNNGGGLVIDNLGRQVLQNAQSNPLVLNSANFGSNYNVGRTVIPVKTAFGQSGVTECTNNCTVQVVTGITLPDGTQYQFKYDCDSSANSACGSPSGQSAYYGTLISVTLPTGGQVTYNYFTFSDSYGNKVRWLDWRGSAGVGWTYSPQVLSTCSSSQVGCQEQVTISKPGGASTVYTFTLNNGAWPVQVQGFDAFGNSLETVANTFDFSNSCVLANCIGASYIRLLSRVTTVPAPGGTSLSKKIALTYDTPQKGNVTANKEWKFYPGTNPTFPSVPDRATYITYPSPSPGPNIINKPASTTLCNNAGSDADCPGGGAKVNQTKITYDSYGTNLCGGPSGLVPVNGVVNHDDAGFGSGNIARGNPTQIQRWVSGSTFLTTSLLYDTTGQVVQSVDPAGNPTCYNYADNFFDETGPSAMSSHAVLSAPTNAYPKTVTVGGLTSTFGYYFGSGKQAFFTDPNNQTTSHFFWDAGYGPAFDRPTQTVYPFGWKLATYTGATQADSYVAVGDTSASSSCTSCLHNQINLDSWGRKVNEKLVNAPGGAINVDTTYDQTGRVQSVSHAYVNPSDPSHVFETFVYDGADRKIAVTHPDNQSARVFYGPLVTGTGAGGLSAQQGSTSTYGLGFPVLTVDETGTKKKQEWLDGFGQIIEVDEPTTGPTPGIGSVAISGSEQSTQVCRRWAAGGDCLQWVTVYDHGTVSITINGVLSSVSYGSGSTSSSIATGLASAISSNGSINSLVSASASGATVTITAKQGGSQTNYSLSATATSGDTNDFPDGSFYTAASGSSLTGGFDAGSLFSTPQVTLYIYDVLGNLTQVIQGLQSRTLTHDGLGRITSMTTPEGGTDSFYFTQSDNVSLCAGSPKAVCRKTDARGITTTYTYNSRSQLTGKSYSNNQSSVTYQYDQGGAAAFALGHLTSMTDASGSETYSYDQGGRITQKQKVIGTTTYPVQYQYNPGGELTQITYPSGRTVQQTPDNVGRLNMITTGSSRLLLAMIPNGTGYNAAGQILAITYGNGVTGSFSYSAARQQLTSLSYSSNNYPYPVFFALNYGYQNGQANCGTSGTAGNNGLIQCIQDTTDNGGPDNGRSVIYSYDALGRLSTAMTTGSTGPNGYAQWGLSWVYDQYGNRVSQNQTAGSPPMNSLSFATTPAPPANPPGGAYTNRPDGYSFDASGNMLNDGQNNLAYDAENCLLTSANSSSGTSNYTCDSHGIRVKKALQGGTTTVYVFSGANDISEYDNGAPVNSPSREYIYLAGQLIATIQGTTTTFHHGDHLSVRLSTDGTPGSPTYGQIVGEQGHYPYGEQWYAHNTTTKFFFTSYERDSESGNDYAMARFYINRFGRFSCVDPSLGTPGDPQSWNRYAYARNNPVNISDPSGQFWLFKLIGALLAIIGILLEPFSAGASSALIKIGLSIAGVGFGTPGSLGNAPGTPPTFPDPLGNTQATLNSIYHPIDPSQFGINNFLYAGTGSQIYLQDMGPCTKGLFGITTRAFQAVVYPNGPGGTGHPGVFGKFSGTLNDPSGLQFDFDVFTDPNSYTMQLGGPPMARHTFGYVDPPHPFINYVSTGLVYSEALDTQIIETGNSLYLISGRLSLQQMHARDNADSKTRPNQNDPPGIDLLDCLEGYGPFGRFGRR